MAAICTDGDSTLIGRYNGLGAKLRKTVGYLLSVHCAAHKTALALGDTAKEMEDLQELDVVLKAVHNLFSKSGSRQMQWTRFARRRGVSKLQYPLFNATMRFSRAQCVGALQENLVTLILFLKRNSGKKGWEKVADLLKSVTDVTFICLLHSVADVLVEEIESNLLECFPDGDVDKERAAVPNCPVRIVSGQQRVFEDEATVVVSSQESACRVSSRLEEHS
ncbi:hypothetical protein AXG93_4773s1490 [Marchantia polymorpha subsp. ruderalis]|uniref:DUF4371 domain-containing protein n=1 Tax=Marchantia polymorpha subsp. ruderalis TaxID=1480154 RepID=A0A176WLB8_MARPO|nr:hypothetical protein AXG93_4773s1490 [Marchantia polymorpha subsp. ruderalis]